MSIQHAKAGTILTIYNSPIGAKDDDFTVIKIRKDIVQAVSLKGFWTALNSPLNQIKFPGIHSPTRSFENQSWFGILSFLFLFLVGIF